MKPKRPGIPNTSTPLSEFWFWVVQEYSKRKFSFLEDKAFAVEGVVEMLRDMFGAKCYYGVWETFPVECLM
jgi:hypothetical protein